MFFFSFVRLITLRYYIHFLLCYAVFGLNNLMWVFFFFFFCSYFFFLFFFFFSFLFFFLFFLFLVLFFSFLFSFFNSVLISFRLRSWLFSNFSVLIFRFQGSKVPRFQGSKVCFFFL